MPAWLQHDWCSSFVLALGHFLWQGTLIAVVLAIALRATKTVSVRYWLSLAALLLMAVSPVVTLGWLLRPMSHVVTLDAQPIVREEPAPSQPTIPFEETSDVGQVSNLPVSPPIPPLDFNTTAPIQPPAPADERSWWQKFAPQLTTTYLCGVALMLLRLVFGLWGGRRLRRRVHLIDDSSLLAAMRRQAAALGLKLLPVLAYCERVTVPTVVGVLKPMILLPLTLTSGLSPEQMESVLAHELAHLRRYDHLVNLLQRVIESLLFFHPALWWVSHRIRDEREHCCDDLVVACGAMPLDYAKSLLRVAELSRRGRETRAELGRSVAAVSLLATGDQPSNLRQRISRLLGESATPSLRISPRVLLASICVPLVAVIATIQSGASNLQTLPPADEDQISTKSFITKLPSGATIELIGVGLHPAKSNEWWTANGTRLPNDPRDLKLRQIEVPLNAGPSQIECRGFAVQVSGLPKVYVGYGRIPLEARLVYQLCYESHDESARNTLVTEPSVFTIGSLPSQHKAKTATLRIGMDELQEEEFVRSLDPDGKKQGDNPAFAETKRVEELIQPLRVRSFLDRTELTLKSVPRRRSDIVETAPIAIDKDNYRHDSVSTIRLADGQINYLYQVPHDRIAQFEYRLKRYRHWVTFENVSLQPGQQTDVNVKVESLPDEKPRAGRGSPDPALDPTAGLPNSDEETKQPNNANGDLRSNPAAGSGDPRRAQDGKQEAANAKPALRITGRVVDAETGKVIDKIRMVPTSVSRDDAKDITWQTQYLKNFTDGRFVYETAQPWEKTKLRIEAEGYQPAMTRIVKKGEVVELDLKLKRAVLSAEVRLPNGERVAKAQVVLATWTNEINITAGKLAYGHHGERLRKIVETDEQGRFVLPAEIDPSVLVVAHEAGYAEVANAEKGLIPTPLPASDTPGDKPQFETRIIELQPWGRVEGRVLIGDKPVVGAKYSVYQARTDDVHVVSGRTIVSDAEGRFVVEHLPPGRHGTCQRFVDGSDAQRSYSIDGLLHRFDVPPGKTTTLELGGRGRTLTGKLALPEGFPHKVDWSKVSTRVDLQPPRFSGRFGGKDESGAVWSQFKQSDEGKLYGRANVPIAADGSFRIESLPAAEYQLVVSASADAALGDSKPAGQILSGSSKFSIPAVVLPDATQPIDLGLVDLKSLVPLTNMSEWGRGEAKNGLRARVVPVLSSMSEEAIDPAQRVTKFAKANDVAFVVELENVSDKPIKLLDVWHNAKTGEPIPDSDWLSQFVCSVVLFDRDGKLIEQPEIEVGDPMFALHDAQVATLQPGKTQQFLIKTVRWLPTFKPEIQAGSYRVAVRYQWLSGPNAARIRTANPKSSLLEAAAVYVVSAAVAIEVGGESRKADLVWGEAINGLRAAVSFEPPKRTHAHGEMLAVNLHLQNVGTQPLKLVSDLSLPDASATIKNDRDKRVALDEKGGGLSPRMSGLLTLKPQQVVVLDAGDLGLAISEEQANQFDERIMRKLIAPAGKYAMQLQTSFDNVLTQRVFAQGQEIVRVKDAWVGKLMTGASPLVIAAAPAVGVRGEVEDKPAEIGAFVQVNPPPVVGDFAKVDDPDVLLDQLAKNELPSLVPQTGGGFFHHAGAPPQAMFVTIWESQYARDDKLDPRIRRLIELGDRAVPRVHQRLNGLAASDLLATHLTLVLRSAGGTESVSVLIKLLKTTPKTVLDGKQSIDHELKGFQASVTQVAVTSALWKLTGRKHIFTPDQWEKWWLSVKPDFVVLRDRQRPEFVSRVTLERVNALANDLATNEVAARERLISLGPAALSHLLTLLAVELPKPPLNAATQDAVNVSPQSVRLAWVIDELGATDKLPAKLRREYFERRMADGDTHVGSCPIDEDAFCRALSHCSFAEFCSICMAAPGRSDLRGPWNWMHMNSVVFSRRFGKQPAFVFGDPANLPLWHRVTPTAKPQQEIADAVPVLIAALNHRDTEQREMATKLADIVGLCSTEKPEALIVALRDRWLSEPEANVRVEIGSAMSRFASPIVNEAVLKGLRSERLDILGDAAAFMDGASITLNDTTRPDFERLVQLTRHENDRIRRCATRSLAYKAPQLLGPEFERLCTDKVKDIREACTLALRSNPDPKHADILFKLAGDAEQTIRESAFSSIANLNHPPSMKRLLPHLRDKKVQGYAVSALASMGGEDALPLMMSELEAGNDVDGMVYQHLRRLTGERFEEKPEPWLAWWKKNKPVPVPNKDSTANSPRDSLEFLKLYPKLQALLLDMTELQFLEIVKQQGLKTRKTVEGKPGEGEKVTHHIALGDGHTLIVMFGKDAKCSGIQRVRGEEIDRPVGDAVLPENPRPQSRPDSKNVAEKPTDSGVQALPPPLEFRFAAQPAGSKAEPRVPADYAQRDYSGNSVIGRMVAKDKGFIWVGVANPKDQKISSLPVERLRGGQVREVLLADTSEHALAWNSKWSIEDCRVVPVESVGQVEHFSIELKLNEAGGAAMRTLTKSHLNQPLAILVNNIIIAAPIVREEFGQNIAITGTFTREQAETLAAALSVRPQAASGIEKKLGRLSRRFVDDGEPPVPKDFYARCSKIDVNQPQQPGANGTLDGTERLYRDFLTRNIRPKTTDQSCLLEVVIAQLGIDDCVAVFGQVGRSV